MIIPAGTKVELKMCGPSESAPCNALTNIGRLALKKHGQAEPYGKNVRKNGLIVEKMTAKR